MKKGALLLLLVLSIIQAKSQDLFFIDPAIEQAIINQGYDTDFSGTISQEESWDIFDLDLSYSGVTMLWDLQQLNLFSVNLEGNYFYELDMSVLFGISEINASNCSITTFIPPNTTFMQSLNLSNNDITSLNLSQLDQLFDLNISNNPNLASICLKESVIQGLLLQDQNTPNYNLTSNCCSFTSAMFLNHTSCPTTADGRASANTYPSGSYTFALNDGPFSSNSSINNIAIGDHIYLIKEQNGCVDTNYITIGTSVPEIVDLGSDTTICNSAEINIGVTESYNQITWSTGASSQMIEAGLGTYTIETTDNGGCTQRDTIEITGKPCVDLFSSSPGCISRSQTTHYLSGSQSEYTTTLYVNKAGEGVLSGDSYSAPIIVNGTPHTNQGNQDMYFSKFSSDGSEVWTEVIGTSVTDRSGAITLDEAGNAYFSMETNDFTSYTVGGQLIHPQGNMTIVKLDSVGNYVWHQGVTAGNAYLCTDIVVKEDGNIYATGQRFSSGTFEFGGVTIPEGSIFIIKIDPNGNVIDGHGIDAPANGDPALAVDHEHNILLTFRVLAASVQLSPTFNKALDSEWQQLIVKYDSSFNVAWAYRFNPSFGQSGVDVEVDSEGHVYALGYYYGDMFDIGSFTRFYSQNTSNLSAAAYLVRLNKLGGTQWSKNLTNESHVVPMDLEIRNDIVYANVISNNSSISVDDFTYPSGNSYFTLAVNSDDGNIIWGNGDYTFRHIGVSDNSDIWTYGTFQGSYNGFNSQGGLDGVIQKLNHMAQPGPVTFDTAACGNTQIDLFGGNDASAYLWSNGDKTETTSLIPPSAMTIQRLSARGCWSSPDEITSTALPVPSADLPDSGTVLQGQPLTLDAMNIGSDFTWSTGATTQSINLDYATTPDTSLVWVRIENSDNCVNYDTTIVFRDAITFVRDMEALNASASPSPFGNRCVVSSDVPCTFIVSNMKGLVVESGEIEKSVEIGEGLPAGIYAVRLTSENKTTSFRIIKQ